MPQCRSVALLVIICLCVYAQLRMALAGSHRATVEPVPIAPKAEVVQPAPWVIPPSPPPPPPPLPLHAEPSEASGRRSAASPSSTSSSSSMSSSTSSSSTAEGGGATSGASEVHVVVAADREQWAGVIGVINSVRRNCAQPARLRVHVVVTAGTEGAFGAFLRCHGVAREHLEVLGFSAARLPKIKVSTLLTNLESPLNFARFYLHELLPAVPKVRCGPACPLPGCLLCTPPFTAHLPTVHLLTVHLLTMRVLTAHPPPMHPPPMHPPTNHPPITMHLLITCAPALCRPRCSTSTPNLHPSPSPNPHPYQNALPRRGPSP